MRRRIRLVGSVGQGKSRPGAVDGEWNLAVWVSRSLAQGDNHRAAALESFPFALAGVRFLRSCYFASLSDQSYF